MRNYGVLEAINAEGVSIRDKTKRKDNDKIINEGIGIYYKEKI